MGFTSILKETPYGKKPSELQYPAFFQDLNIDQIVDRMLLKWQDYPLKKYFYYPATTEENVRYRREVYQEMEDPKLWEAVMQFSRSMKQSRKFMEYREETLRLMGYQEKRKSLTAVSSRTAGKIKSRHLLYDGAKCYVEAVEALQEELAGRQMESGGLREFWEFLVDYEKSAGFQKLREDVARLSKELGKLRFCINLEQNKLTVKGDYDDFDARQALIEQCNLTVSTKQDKMSSPFNNILEIKEFEGLLLSMLQRPRKEVFAVLAEFEKEHEDFLMPEFVQFEEEVQVYLAAANFFRDMRGHGFDFTFAGASGSLSLDSNYDLALACKLSSSPKEVVANDCYLGEGERLYVITGPNQGGKTTFARAVGQALYMNQMGFPVAGTRAKLPVFPVLLTHFPVEEDIKTGAGKLKEELNRLEPMLHAQPAGGFVILNELFTTATTYDAQIMGTKVIKQFLDNSFCGIYVTHMKALAECDDRVVSLVAQVYDDDTRRRSYKICRAAAQGIAYAQTIAQRYRLSREEILERVRDTNFNFKGR